MDLRDHWDRWLAQVAHDLVKRLLWPARDRRDLGGPVQPGELTAVLADDDGAPISAARLWLQLRAQAPAPAAAGGTLDRFGAALDLAVAAAAADDLAGVLTLEAALEQLARNVKHGDTPDSTAR